EIEKTLQYIDSLLAKVESNAFKSPIEKLGMERLVHTVIESIIDVGNMMIDGFIMRDPGSYHDIIDILIDEKVIPEPDELFYKEFIDLRQMIVQNYLEIDHDKIESTLLKDKKVILQFSTHIRAYLQNELGVAHAFSNEPKE